MLGVAEVCRQGAGFEEGPQGALVLPRAYAAATRAVGYVVDVLNLRTIVHGSTSQLWSGLAPSRLPPRRGAVVETLAGYGFRAPWATGAADYLLVSDTRAIRTLGTRLASCTYRA